MGAFPQMLDGIANSLTPANLLLLGAGVFVGMIVGILPGLGPSAAIAILIPLTFGFEDKTGAVVMLAAIYYGAMYGGTITSVLINTPGESASVATTFDGYPLAQQGKAGAVLVLCAVGSFIAGTIGAFLISLLAPPFTALARSFGPAEYFLTVVIGLLLLVVIIGGNRVYGTISALLGFGLATVGIDIGTGQQRFTFGSPELIGGIDFIPVAIGLFGLGELLYGMSEGEHTQDYRYQRLDTKSGGFWPEAKDWVAARGAMFRGSVMGFFIGTLPGAGATIASVLSYSAEKGISKTPEKFGKGAMAGVVGPEAANNAASAGAMVPLLTLGIPGSGSTAVLLAAFILWGLRPGPLLMTQQPEFAWTLIGSMYMGNMMLVVLNIFAIPLFASFMRVPYRVVVPTVVVLCAIGTFTVNGSQVETWILIICGGLGYFMKRFGFSPAAAVVALVLGPLAEESLRQSLTISGGSLGIFWTRPESRVLVIVLGVLIIGPLLYKLFKRSRSSPVDEYEQEMEKVKQSP